jgi:hypothetical protein
LKLQLMEMAAKDRHRKGWKARSGKAFRDDAAWGRHPPNGGRAAGRVLILNGYRAEAARPWISIVRRGLLVFRGLRDAQ